MQTPNIPPNPDEFLKRIETLQTYLRKENTDGALVLQKADLFYFSGTAQDAQLYIPVKGDPLLMVKKHVNRAAAESPFPVIPLKSTKQVPDLLKENGCRIPDRLGLELDVLPAALYLNYERLFQGTRLVDVSHPIRLVRSVKSDYEIGIIESAARMADEVLDGVKDLIREGMTEIELAGMVEARARKLGHQGLVRMRLWGGELFYGHLMAGPSAAEPSFLSSPTGGAGTSPAVPQSAGFNRIQRGTPVLVDYVFAHQGYISDQTRIFALGDIPDDLKAAHHAMMDIQEMLKQAATPGTKAGELYDAAVRRAEELGYADWFMGADAQRIRFVGHGVGIELDEYPFIAKGQQLPLKKGMVIALEPKVIMPGRGVVGIENTHVVTDSGLKTLNRFPEDIILM
ncbi:MAG: M24 family metallopeptidase [Thermodesulfobacteriota bacterium]